MENGFVNTSGSNDLSHMNEYGISSEKTNHLKAVALIFMFFHHFFGCNSHLKLPQNEWISLFPELFAFYCESLKICISIFLFCTGYGIYKSYFSRKNSKTYILKRLVKLFIPYWTVMALTIFYLCFAGKFVPQYLFDNLFTLINDDRILYVSFSWYIKLYMCLILLAPVIKCIENRIKRNILLDIALFIVVPTVIGILLSKYNCDFYYENIIWYLLSTISQVFLRLPVFSMGLIFAKYDIYGWIRKKTERIPKWLLILVSFVCCFCVIGFRGLFNFYPISDTVYSPIFIVPFLLIYDSIRWKSKFVIPYIGKHSIFYWLLSGLFFVNTSELQFILYLPKYALLVMIWAFLIITPFVYLCDWISSKILNLICRKL